MQCRVYRHPHRGRYSIRVVRGKTDWLHQEGQLQGGHQGTRLIWPILCLAGFFDNLTGFW